MTNSSLVRGILAVSGNGGSPGCQFGASIGGFRSRSEVIEL